MIIRWNKMNILILAGHGVPTNTLPLHSMDLLWVRENAALPEKETFYKWKAKTVILDGSNGTRQAVRWEEFCSALNTPSHRIVEKGPFVMKIAYPTFAPSEKKFCTLFH